MEDRVHNDFTHAHVHSHSHSHGHPHSHHTQRPINNESDWEEERRLFNKVLKTFSTYKEHAKGKLKWTMRYIESLPERQQILLTDYKNHVQSFNTFIDVNQNLFHLIVNSVGQLYENHNEIYGNSNEVADNRPPLEPTPLDYDRLNSVMKQFVRDWSAEGAKEREACFGPILNEIDVQFGNVECKENVKILVPGAGTGRLSNEIVRRGYATQGNEFSMYMLFASNFILNKCYDKNIHTCYPWLSETGNVLHHEHQIRPIRLPDIDPSDLPPNCKFSMTAGDFLEVYQSNANQGAWDCIATCFFIDCATNIVSFVERIYGCLKENGVWINLGPLLYHYADLADEKSIEPSYDFLIQIIKNVGFKLEKENLNVPTKFAANAHSMLSYSYNSIFFVCRRTESVESEIETTIQKFRLRESESVDENNGFKNDIQNGSC